MKIITFRPYRLLANLNLVNRAQGWIEVMRIEMVRSRVGWLVIEIGDQTLAPKRLVQAYEIF